MSAPWRIGEVAQRLGLSTDTVREYVRRGILPATRSPSGQLLFEEEDVETIRRGEVRTNSVRGATEAPKQPKVDDQVGMPAWKALAPWQTDVEAARASLMLDDLEAERERREEEREAERHRRTLTSQRSAASGAERQRVERHKQRVFRTMWIPQEFRPQVAARIQAFATPGQIPPWLSDAEQYEMLWTHARTVLDQLTAEEQRAANERQRAASQAFADQVSSLFQRATSATLAAPGTPPARPMPPSSEPALPPKSVAEALRRRGR